MRIGIPEFSGQRLVEARNARGMTQVGLADLINRTSSSISRWEGGDQSPELDAVEALSAALNVPVSFFMHPLRQHGDRPLFFRSMASTTLTVRRRTESRLRWAQNISLVLQEWLDFPSVDLPHLNVNDYRGIGDQDIERVAADCRTAWGLGQGPISDVLLAMENAGVVAVKEATGTVTMDGLSNWSDEDQRPYVLIAQDKDTCVRSRMDAAHELGHLVLHRHISWQKLNSKADFKEIERQAFLFASAFLLPSESFPSEVWSPSLNTFLALKERWKVSIAAMIMRCSKLDMIGDEYQQRLWKHYNSRGWRREEPLDDVLVPEEPRLLSRSIRLVLDEGVVTHDDLLAQIALRGSDVESLCNLPRGFLSQGQAEVIKMPTLKKDQPSDGGGAAIVQFPKKH
jgi:Zn-dependent peptidase ImmA (M78 family)/transcriptional regulator with XRE-family HTH domain